MLQGSVEETKGKGKARAGQSPVGVQIGVSQGLPPPLTGSKRVKGWDCGLNLWVVPPCVYMSQFNLAGTLLSRTRKDEVQREITWSPLEPTGVLQSLSGLLRTVRTKSLNAWPK